MRLTWVPFMVATGLSLVTVLSSSSCTPPSCDSNDECNDGFVCAEGPEEGKNQCTAACAADTRCPQGKACVARDDGSFEGACLDITGTFERGEVCTGDRQCVSGACLGEEGTRVCVDVCDVGDACADPDEVCTLEGLRRVCVPPLDDRAAGEACNSPRECASGTCVAAPGEEPVQAVCADNCADAIQCADAAQVCVRLTGGARICLEPLDDGAVCQADAACAGGFCIEDVDEVLKCASACVDGACAAGFGCDVDAVGTKVCLPILDERAAGAACERARECVSGHCAQFVDVDGTDLGTLCADPCDADGECAADLVCWNDDAGTDVCGPIPPSSET